MINLNGKIIIFHCIGYIFVHSGGSHTCSSDYKWSEDRLLSQQEKLGAGERPTLQNFDDFLDKYLKRVFGIESIRKEWALSLYTAGGVMTECEEIVRFRKVVDNEVLLDYLKTKWCFFFSSCVSLLLYSLKFLGL